MKNRKIIFELFITYLIFVFVKIVISLLVKSPSIFADEYYYLKMARSLFYYFNLDIDGITSDYPPLYATLISFLYVLKNPEIIYPAIKIFNAFLSSLIIIPAFLIARGFFNEKKALLIAILVTLLPPFFVVSSYILSENLFYPMFLFTLFFLYKSFSEDNIKYDILAGIFLGLSYLTRVISFALIPTIISITLYYIFINKEYFQLKKKIILFFASFMVVIPWLLRNISIFGFSLNGLFGYSTEFDAIKNFSLISGLYWIVLYLSYIILASGIVFFVFSLRSLKHKEKNISLLFLLCFVTLAFLILQASFHSASYTNSGSWLVGRPLGRYVEGVLPLLIILGVIGFEKEKVESNGNKKLLLFVSSFVFLLLIISFKLVSFSLLPLNNSSLTHIGVASIILQSINKNLPMIFFIFISISTFFVVGISKIKHQKLILLALLHFAFISMLSSAVVVYNANTRWYSLEQTKIGLWFNDYDNGKSIVLFDKNDIDRNFVDSSNLFVKKERSIAVVGYWMNNDIFIDYPNTNRHYDYLFTTTKQNMKLVKSSMIGENKYLYVYKR